MRRGLTIARVKAITGKNETPNRLGLLRLVIKSKIFAACQVISSQANPLRAFGPKPHRNISN